MNAIEKKHVRLPMAAGIFLAAMLVTCMRFYPWQSLGLWGDDLYNYIHFNTGSWRDILHASFAETYFDRYRPIFGLAWAAARELFGLNLKAYALALYAIHALNALLVYLAAARLSRGNTAISFLIAMVFVCSRFALYQVTLLTGMLESISMLFFLVMVWSVIVTNEEPKRAPVMRIISITALMLAVFTHERYLAVVPWLSMAFWVTSSGHLPRERRLAIAATPWILLAFNIALKLFLLQSNVLEGTGGSSIEVNAQQTLQHSYQALMSLGGINRGPEYLTGIQSSGVLQAAGYTFALLFGIAILMGVYRAKNRQYLVLISLLVLALLLLMPPVLTIRLEQRWLFGPCGLMLLALAWVAGQTRSRAVISLIAACCVLLFSIDFVIFRSLGVTYMGYGSAIGSFAAQSIKNGSAGAPGTPLVIQTHPEGCGSLLDGLSYEIMEGIPRKLTCANELDEARRLASSMPDSILFISQSREPRAVFLRETP